MNDGQASIPPPEEVNPLLILEEARARSRGNSETPPPLLERAPLTELIEEHIVPHLTRGPHKSVWLRVPVGPERRVWYQLDSEEVAEYLAQAYLNVTGELLTAAREKLLLRAIRGMAMRKSIKVVLTCERALALRASSHSARTPRDTAAGKSPPPRSPGRSPRTTARTP